MSPEYRLRWNNHRPNLVDNFKDFLHHESLVDVTLAIGGQCIFAHKVILAACSIYFKDIFDVHRQVSHPIIIMNDFTIEDIRTVVDFIYCGEVNIPHQRLPDVLKTAEALRIKGLAESPHTSMDEQGNTQLTNKQSGLLQSSTSLSEEDTQIPPLKRRRTDDTENPRVRVKEELREDEELRRENSAGNTASPPSNDSPAQQGIGVDWPWWALALARQQQNTTSSLLLPPPPLPLHHYQSPPPSHSPSSLFLSKLSSVNASSEQQQLHQRSTSSTPHFSPHNMKPNIHQVNTRTINNNKINTWNSTRGGGVSPSGGRVPGGTYPLIPGLDQVSLVTALGKEVAPQMVQALQAVATRRESFSSAAKLFSVSVTTLWRYFKKLNLAEAQKNAVVDNSHKVASSFKVNNPVPSLNTLISQPITNNHGVSNIPMKHETNISLSNNVMDCRNGPEYSPVVVNRDDSSQVCSILSNRGSPLTNSLPETICNVSPLSVSRGTASPILSNALSTPAIVENNDPPIVSVEDNSQDV